MYRILHTKPSWILLPILISIMGHPLTKNSLEFILWTLSFRENNLSYEGASQKCRGGMMTVPTRTTIMPLEMLVTSGKSAPGLLLTVPVCEPPTVCRHNARTFQCFCHSSLVIFHGYRARWDSLCSYVSKHSSVAFCLILFKTEKENMGHGCRSLDSFIIKFSRCYFNTL